jgi:2'-5' RNA ligase superfamily
MTRRTALIIPVPEAEPAVSGIRAVHDSSAALGVPAHVTILFPFVPPHEVDETALRELFAGFTAFDFTLDRVERFEDGLVWLHPEPARPFAELTAAVWARWPEHPPYEGAHDEVIPHLTVSESAIDIVVPLPIAARAHEVVLIEEVETGERWSVRARYPLAQSGVA